MLAIIIMQDSVAPDRNAFLRQQMASNLAALCMDKGFSKWEELAQSTLVDVTTAFVKKLALEIKSCTELNGRTDSNLLDAMSALATSANTSREQLKEHLREPPFTKLPVSHSAI